MTDDSDFLSPRVNLRQAMRYAVQLAVVTVIIGILLVFGIGEPLEPQELMGLTQQQVRDKYGEPAQTWKRNQNGNDVWLYYQSGLIANAATDVEFQNGVVVKITGHSPNK